MGKNSNVGENEDKQEKTKTGRGRKNVGEEEKKTEERRKNVEKMHTEKMRMKTREKFIITLLKRGMENESEER